MADVFTSEQAFEDALVEVLEHTDALEQDMATKTHVIEKG